MQSRKKMQNVFINFALIDLRIDEGLVFIIISFNRNTESANTYTIMEKLTERADC